MAEDLPDWKQLTNWRGRITASSFLKKKMKPEDMFFMVLAIFNDARDLKADEKDKCLNRLYSNASSLLERRMGGEAYHL